MKFIILLILIIYGVASKPPLTVPYVGLKHVGSINSVNDEGTNYEKNFYFSTYLTAKPIYVRSVCKSFGLNMDIAAFESRSELQRIQTKLSTEMNQNQPESTRTHGVVVGGMTHNINGRNNFFWTTSGLKVDQVNENQSENCLGIKKSGGNLIFTGMPCDREYTFVCQHLELNYAK